jgi:hypothetical protein
VITSTKEKIVDKGIKRVRKAMEESRNPLSEGEMHFVRTCCRILKIDKKEKINSIGEKAVEDGRGKV